MRMTGHVLNVVERGVNNKQSRVCVIRERTQYSVLL